MCLPPSLLQTSKICRICHRHISALISLFYLSSNFIHPRFRLQRSKQRSLRLWSHAQWTMASATRPPLQTDTPTRLAVSPGHPLSVQEFLHSLKKSTRKLPAPKRVEAPQHNTLTRPCNPAEAAEVPKLQPIASTDHGDLRFIGATVPGPDLLGPPESPDEIDDKQALSPSPKVKRLQPPNLNGTGEKVVSIKIPKVVRTYAKKIKHVSPVGNPSSDLFLTQSSTHEGALLDGLLDEDSDAPTEQLACGELSKTMPAKKHNSAIPPKRKRQPLQDDEEIRREDHNEDDVDMTASRGTERTRRKKRRAPVKELALVTRLPSHEYSTAKAQVRTSFGQDLVWVSIRPSAHFTINFTRNFTIPTTPLTC